MCCAGREFVAKKMALSSANSNLYLSVINPSCIGNNPKISGSGGWPEQNPLLDFNFNLGEKR